MVDGQEDELVDLCFKITEFFQAEIELYNNHARNNDYLTYMNGFKIAFERLFPNISKRDSKPPVPPKN